MENKNRDNMGVLVKQHCICDNCKKNIEINVQEKVIDQDREGKDITEQFFVCPECGQHYTITIFDQFIRQKIAARKCLKKMSKNCNLGQDAKLVKEMQRHIKELKDKYGRKWIWYLIKGECNVCTYLWN